ncbi:MAG: hypothetical protein JW940_01295 [Polyangiaceae bacterium]|nr:hypothetical protein [Polyangiaceae bacterium]
MDRSLGLVGRWVGGSVALVSCTIALLTAATSTLAPAARSLSSEERRAIARKLAEEEEPWRRGAARAFPGDLWSRDDAFFSYEQLRIRNAAMTERTAPGDILLGIDELLRQDPRGRKTGAAPCKPRPFFD